MSRKSKVLSEQPESNRWPFDFRRRYWSQYHYHYSQTLYQLSYARNMSTTQSNYHQTWPGNFPNNRIVSTIQTPSRHTHNVFSSYSLQSPRYQRHIPQLHFMHWRWFDRYSYTYIRILHTCLWNRYHVFPTLIPTLSAYSWNFSFIFEPYILDIHFVAGEVSKTNSRWLFVS